MKKFLAIGTIFLMMAQITTAQTTRTTGHKHDHDKISPLVKITYKGRDGKMHEKRPTPIFHDSKTLQPFGDITVPIPMGNINPKDSITYTMWFGNSTSMYQSYSSPTITGDNAADFVVSNNNCSGSQTSDGSTCTFDVTFTPYYDDVIEKANIAFVFTDHWCLDGTNDCDPYDPTQIYTTTGTATDEFSGTYIDDPPDDPCKAKGSIIYISNQSVGEVIPVVGTNLTLNYASALAPEYKSTQALFSSVDATFSFNKEGWTNSLQHLYSASQSRLFLGTGTAQAAEYATLSDGNLMVVSHDGGEIYTFTPAGQHLQTQSALTGAVKYTFGYDTNSNLTTITDAYGNVTTFIRDTNGNISQITGPYGQVTTFTVDSSGHFLTVTNPNSETYTLTYQSGTGLLATFANPGGQVSTLSYDTNGKLTEDLGNGGNFWTLVANAGVVTKSSEMNRQSTYSLTYGSDGSSSEAATTSDGFSSTHTEYIGGSSADSSSLNAGTLTLAADERFGYIYNRPSVSTSEIGGNTSTTNYVQSVAYPSGVTPGYFNYSTITKTATTSSRTTTSVFNASTMTQTTTSAVGATAAVVLDSYERPTSFQIGSDNAINYTYDSNGRLSGSVQGTSFNQKTYAYNTAGLLQSVTDALSEATQYAYDLAGRVTSVTLPDSRVIGYTYDSNGNMTSVTPPSKPAHNFTFNAMELTSAYQPPTLTGVSTVNTTYTYNLDKQLTQITRPDGTSVTNNYNATTGLLSSKALGRGSFAYSYNTNTSQLSSVTGPDGYSNSMTYQGTLLTAENQGTSSLTWGFVNYTYDTDFRLSSRSLHGAFSTPAYTENYTYNSDNMPTQVGDMSITYTYPSGRLSTTSIGTISDARTYDSNGQLASYTATYTPSGGAAQTLYSYSFTRDSIGRISMKSETIQGVTDTYSYTYDTAGRLTQVLKDGAAYSSYTYDSNSNRTSGTTAGSAFTATYDNQDRMTAYNSTTFTYNANGDRTQNSYSTGKTATFTYDELGQLLGGTNTGGNSFVYNVDGFNRRVHKTKNGAFKYQFIYDNRGRIAASEGSGAAIQAEFIYATDDRVPDYMYVVSSAAEYRIITDHLGSPRLMVNTATGAVSQRMDYNDLGVLVSDTNDGFQPFGFAGGVWDSALGLVRFGARDYDAADGGVWMSKDPILFKGGDTNLYGYVLNDPINHFDPTGLACFYSQSSGTMICSDTDGNMTYVGSGYSGSGAGTNNSSMESAANIGPVPQGSYTTSAPYSSDNTGPNTISLNPDSATSTSISIMGRDPDSFRIHGNNSTNDASHGCIVLPPNRTNIPPGETVNVVE